MRITTIIQARMGSTRLPGKIMMKINGVRVIECQLQQLAHSSNVDNVIFATTTNPEDDIIVDFANSNLIKIFRGSALDVLDRYYQCAKQFSLEHIVRITSDCPLVDPLIVDRTIELYKTKKFDYVSNFYQSPAYPSGTDVEVFSFQTLEKTWENTSKPYDREHVTPYIYNNPDLFSIGYITANVDMSNLHYSVDTINDLELVRTLYKKISHRPILLDDILKAV